MLATIDVFIKDEGYADIRFITLKSKEWAHKNKFKNSLEHFGKTFCGRSVWRPGLEDGLYHTPVDISKMRTIISKMKRHGLQIESEI